MSWNESKLSRRKVLKGAGSLAVLSMVPRLARAQSQPTPGGTVQTSSIAFNGTEGKIPSKFMGLSFEKIRLNDSYFHTSYTDTGGTYHQKMDGLCKLLGSGAVLRIGANTVDRVPYLESGSYTPGNCPGQAAPPTSENDYTATTLTHVTDLASFLSATGWSCLYALDLIETNDNPNFYLADTQQEVSDVAAHVGNSLMGFEIGNEPDLYYAINPDPPRCSAWNVSNYEYEYEKLLNNVATQSAGKAFTGPATGAKENVSSWTSAFASAEKNNINLVTQHYYREGNSKNQCTDLNNLLKYPDSNLRTLLSSLQTIQSNTGLPFRISECNSVFNGGENGVCDVFGSALWVLDFLFNCAMYGATGVNIMGGNAGSTYGPYSPLGFDSSTGDVNKVLPIFYGLYFFQLAGTGTVWTWGSKSDQVHGINCTAYAVQATSGGPVNLVLVNKDPSISLDLSVDVSQFGRSFTAASVIQMQSGAPGAPACSDGNLLGTTPNIGGHVIDLKGTAFTPTSYTPKYLSSTSVEFYVPAASAVMIKLS